MEGPLLYFFEGKREANRLIFALLDNTFMVLKTFRLIIASLIVKRYFDYKKIF